MLTNSLSFMGILFAALLFLQKAAELLGAKLPPQAQPWFHMGAVVLFLALAFYLLRKNNGAESNCRMLHLRKRFYMPSLLSGVALALFSLSINLFLADYRGISVAKVFSPFTAIHSPYYWVSFAFDVLFFMGLVGLSCGLMFSIMEKKTSAQMAAILSSFLICGAFFKNESFLGMFLAFCALHYLVYRVNSILSPLVSVVFFVGSYMLLWKFVGIYESFGFWDYLPLVALIFGFLVAFFALGALIFGFLVAFFALGALVGLEKNEDLIQFKKFGKKAIFAVLTPGFALFLVTFIIKIYTDYFSFLG